MRYTRVCAVAGAAATAVALGLPPVQAAVSNAPGDGTDVPGVVTIVGAGPGGGSGEVLLTWNAVADATGYQVLRSDTAEGPFERVAEFDVTTGSATAASDVVNVYSDEHSYIPPRGSLDGPDRSARFNYVDLGNEQRCFRVIAFNKTGDGPPSVVACGAPPGVELAPATPISAEPAFTG